MGTASLLCTLWVLPACSAHDLRLEAAFPGHVSLAGLQPGPSGRCCPEEAWLLAGLLDQPGLAINPSWVSARSKRPSQNHCLELWEELGTLTNTLNSLVGNDGYLL